ncbi:MAG: DUF4416 family protein [Deltaproteobacteria bacterium]|nr:DUF4416 family protein [Deltaproteobacteria bacterium]
MSKPEIPPPVLLVLGVLHTDEAAAEAALAAFVERFGPVERMLGPLPFDCTDYYDAEMGTPITRRFLLFRDPVSADCLPEVKLFTNAIEERFASDGKRRVNQDPGLLTPVNLVLATGKPRHQRIYLGQGIYGDLTLVYHTGAYQPLPWTYRDWGSEEVRAFLTRARPRMTRALQGTPQDKEM